MVTLHNWEEYAILQADGELDAAGAAALDAFLQQHPELAGEAAVYASLKLVPEEGLVFAGKERLLREEPRVVRLSGSRRWMWAAAAAVVLALGAGLFFSDRNPQVAIQLPAPKAQTKDTSPAQQGTRPFSPQPLPGAVSPASIPPAPVVARAPQHNEPALVQARAPRDAAVARKEDAGLPLEPLAWKPVPALPSAVAAPPPQPPAAIARTEAPQPARDSRHLPILDDGRLQPLQELADAASVRLAALRAAREKLRDAEVTVAVGRRELFRLSF